MPRSRKPTRPKPPTLYCVLCPGHLRVYAFESGREAEQRQRWANTPGAGLGCDCDRKDHRLVEYAPRERKGERRGK